MHSQSVFVAFLILALSSFTAQAAPASNHDQSECSPAQVQTVFETVTVTASSATSTSGSSSNNNQSGSNNNQSGSNNQSSSNNQSNSSSSSSSSSSNNNNNNDGKNNNGKNNNGKNNTNNNNTSSTATASTATNTNAANTANNTGNSSSVDAAQTSLTLDPRVIAQGFANNGQDVPTAGQVPSLTSTNNFINFCLTVPNLSITNGKQITAGSCNPAPIGVIPSTDNMPSAKFSSPKNFDTIKANTAFTIEMNIRGMQTGFFVNADENYFAAPQQLNAQGQIQGHSHVVIEQLDSLEQPTPTDPKNFAFFKGLNSAAVNGKLAADVTAGLPAGVYRLASINTNANHAPAIVPVAQHGSLDDAIYFTVTADGKPSGGAVSSAVSSVTASSSTSPSSASVSAASGSASAFVSVSASKTASASVTSTALTTKVSSVAASSTVKASSSAKASSSTEASLIAKASSTARASSTTEASASASDDKATSSAAVPTTTPKVAAEAPPKAARDLRFRHRWNLGK